MSCYLQIKKNGVLLSSFSRNDPITIAIDPPHCTENWEKIDDWFFSGVEEKLDEDIISYEKAIRREKMFLGGNISAEDRYESIKSIESFKEEIEEVKDTKSKIIMLQRILLEQSTNEPNNNEWFYG